MARPPDDHPQGPHPVEQVTRTLERVLLFLLAILTLTTLAGALLIMLNMDGSSRSQGGRYYVAIAAWLILGAIDSGLQKLIKRRIPFSLTTTPQERRYSIVSLLLMVIAGVVLIGLAWLLS